MRRSVEKKTLRVLIDAANSILEYLEFTGEVSEDREDPSSGHRNMVWKTRHQR